MDFEGRSMTIRFTCTQCSSVLKIKDELAGTNGHCPKCKVEFVVPAVVSEAIPRTAELMENKSDENGSSDPRSKNDLAVSSQQSTDADLDSPPLIVMKSDDERESPPMLVMQVEEEPDTPSTHVVKQVTKTSLTKPVASEPFDPAKFLNGESPKAGRAPYPSSPINVLDHELDAARSDSDLPSGRVKKSSRQEAASTSTATKTPEASPLDHVKLAKQMMQAMKESNTQAAAQREDEKNPGFDFAGMFREIGLKGGGGLALILGTAFGLYTFSNYIMGGNLKLPKLGHVSGIVSLDGTPLAGANVYFSPQEAVIAGSKRDRVRTSIGVTDAKGHYKMQYMGGIDGVAVGKCRVWVNLPTPLSGQSIPGEYGEGSMLAKEVVAGSQVIPFDMKSKR